ncbi:phosphopyruvate hydratase [Bacteroidota bacterium]|nr:phosphopyruvate hydratase [Bacteroidota bacterium]
MSIIKRVIGRQIIDSRGTPTVEAEVFLENGVRARGIAPSGASTGKYEAVELRDNDSGSYFGKGVSKAVSNINTIISNNLIGESVNNQSIIDQKLIDLDSTENKSNLGANTILAVSLACASAFAKTNNKFIFESIRSRNTYTLPVPMMNILNGGSHADNSIDIQEFMIMPVGANSFKDAVKMGVEIFYSLKSLLKSKNLSTNVGDEGGFAPNLSSNEHAIEVILKSIENAGYKMEDDILLSIDAAASEFYCPNQKKYHFKKSSGRKKTTIEMIEFWKSWINQYPIFSIEDALDEDDWQGWTQLNKEIGNKVQLVGDDLFVTNEKKIIRGIKEKAANAVLIKPNQIGTLSETINAVNLAKANNFNTVMSHRSGETEDTIIADLAVALGTSQIKTGSLSRSDRVAKYNRLLRIEEEIGNGTIYLGNKIKF